MPPAQQACKSSMNVALSGACETLQPLNVSRWKASADVLPSLCCWGLMLDGQMYHVYGTIQWFYDQSHAFVVKDYRNKIDHPHYGICMTKTMFMPWVPWGEELIIYLFHSSVLSYFLLQLLGEIFLASWLRAGWGGATALTLFLEFEETDENHSL